MNHLKPRVFYPLVFFIFTFLFFLPLCLAEESPTLPPKALPGFSALGNLGIVPTFAPSLSYSGWLSPDALLTSLIQNRLLFQTPLSHTPSNTWSLSGGISQLHFGDPETLASTQTPIPVDLWKIEIGGAYLHQLSDHKIIGGRLSVGSASDHPFADFDVTTLGVSAFYSWESSEHSRWMLTLLFSNNNPIANYAPIPGFIYIYHTQTFIGMLGLPFSSLVWTPLDPWMFTFSFFGPTLNSEIAYGHANTCQIFTGFSWLQQSFLRVNRPDPKDRLYFSEKHLPLGVRFLLAEKIKTEFSAGYTFDRSVFEGTHFSSKENGIASLGHDWYGAWNLKLEI